MALSHELNFPFPTNLNASVSFSAPSKEQDEFLRIEDKFVLCAEKIHPVLQEMRRKMNPGYPMPGVHFTLVESIYFDGPGFNFFQDHITGLEERYKVRVRRYAPNGEWSEGPFLLEVKCKKVGICKKFRFKISPQDLATLGRGEILNFNSELTELNQGTPTEKLAKRLRKVNQLIQAHELRPVVSVIYHREAFEKGDFRATLDRQITAHPLTPVSIQTKKDLGQMPLWNETKNSLQKYNVQSEAILEVKYLGSIPSWFEQILQKNELMKTSFSKYCWAMMTNHWAEERQAL